MKMKKTAWKAYAGWILGTEAVGALAGFLTREGTELYKTTIQKPPLSPPAIVFPIVWSVLYALMGFGAARIWLKPKSSARQKALGFYLAQLGFNFGWSLIFFNAQNFGLAFVWLGVLLALIVWMIAYFAKVDRPAAWLQLPYALWVTFAGYLNYGVWMLNR